MDITSVAISVVFILTSVYASVKLTLHLLEHERSLKEEEDYDD